MNNPYMPLYTGDYLRDTMGLTVEQHGAYLLLLVHYWNNGGPFEFDLNTMARVVGVDGSAMALLWQKVGKYFQVDNGMVHNKRSDAELERLAKYYNAKRSNGKAGALKRWKNSETNGEANGETISENIASSTNPNSTTTTTTSAGVKDGVNAEKDPYDQDDHIPTLNEVLEHAKFAGILPRYAQDFWQWTDANKKWFNENGELKKWKLKLQMWQERQREYELQRKGNLGKSGGFQKPTWDRNAGTCNEGVKIARVVE